MSTDISTDISPLAEYFIKANNQIQEYTTNILNNLVNDDDDTYVITSVSSYNDIVRYLGKILSIVTEMISLKLPKLLKDFNKLTPNEYNLLFRNTQFK